jgi:hypothetical protein
MTFSPGDPVICTDASLPESILAKLRESVPA